MNQEALLFTIFLIGIISSYFGNFLSGGISTISIGLMVVFGISPQMAGATFKLGKIGNALSGLYVHSKNGNVPKKLVLGGGLAMMFGAFIGSYLIFSISDGLMYFVSGLSMLVLIGISFFKKVGIHNKQEISRARKYGGFVAYFFLSIVGNMFPAGSGIWYYFANTYIFKLSSLEAKGLGSAVNAFWFTGTFAGLIVSGQYNLLYAISLAIGMVIGGFFGAKHITKIGNTILQKTLLISITIFAFYFLYLAYNSLQ